MGMSISAYFKRPDAMSATQLAAKIGISKGRLSQLRKDGVEWPPELALVAERETGGLLNASELSPIVADARKTGEAA